MPVRARFVAFGRSATKRVWRILRGERGNIAVMFALAAPVLLGGVGVAVEAGNWFYTQRGMQNAADAAALAAVANGSSTYATEAQAVAANYGYVNGTNGVTVTAQNNQPCPDGTSTCYTVNITKPVPLYLAPVLGYSGNTTFNGKNAVALQSAATSETGSFSVQLCLLALGTTSTALLSNGSPKANMTGCSIMSDSSANCNGHNLGASYGLAHHSDSGCGIIQVSNAPIVPDPYAYLAPNIPKNTCTSYPQEPQHKHDPPLPSSNVWSQTNGQLDANGNINLPATTQVCGDLQLGQNVTINDTNGPAVLVIENGQLDTNGFTLTTASGSPVTIIFSGDNSGSYTQAPTGGGTLNIQAPTSGTWSGVAIYQDPSLSDASGGLDISAAGNTPTWDITGLVYLPNANVTFSGAVNKSANGASCFVMVVNDITINGTGDIEATGSCGAAGLSMPDGTVPGRGKLVL